MLIIISLYFRLYIYILLFLHTQDTMSGFRPLIKSYGRRIQLTTSAVSWNIVFISLFIDSIIVSSFYWHTLYQYCTYLTFHVTYFIVS